MTQLLVSRWDQCCADAMLLGGGLGRRAQGPTLNALRDLTVVFDERIYSRSAGKEYAVNIVEVYFTGVDVDGLIDHPLLNNSSEFTEALRQFRGCDFGTGQQETLILDIVLSERIQKARTGLYFGDQIGTESKLPQSAPSGLADCRNLAGRQRPDVLALGKQTRNHMLDPVDAGKDDPVCVNRFA